MESINTLLILLLSVAIVIVVYVVIFSRSRQAQSAAGKARRKAEEEEQRRDAERQAAQRAEEEERQRAEAERRRLEEDLRRAEEERHKAEEERKHLEQEKHRRAEEEHKRFEEEQHRKVQEERKCLDEEAQRKAETQRQTEELQRAEEERRHREADEPQRKAEERQVAEEEDRRARELQREVESKRKPLEPGKRGGRPRASTLDNENQTSQKARPHHPKPEVICRKRERQWIPAVEIPEELFGSPNLAVLQNGLPLTQDESREGCWHLKEAYGQVVVQWKKDEVAREIKIALGEESYLLFKLSGQDQNQGRRVKSPSSGSYLVMVPESWERDDTFSGPPPVTPESVSLTGYQAHFFELEKDGDGKIAFRTPTGESFEIESKAPQFELVGNRLNDASEDKGPLFSKCPPQVRTLDDQAWKDIGTIVIGEEGIGQGRWRQSFSPTSEGTQQDLPSEVMARKGGWYFLRFYDTSDDLIDSLDFRFISALREISIFQPSPLPSANGHKEVRVEFLHEPGCSVQPADSLTNIQIDRQDDKTILTIPPDLTNDETRWLVSREGGPEVEVTILVERLWWAVAKEDEAPSEWKDTRFTLSRDDFAATSNKAIWLRIPRRRWVDAVSVGFEQSKSRSYALATNENTVTVPLRDFGDAQELCGAGTSLLHTWIRTQESSYAGAICEVIVKVGCKFCDFLSSEEKDVFSHIALLHLDEVFSPLTWQEMHARDPSLPDEIYKCSYCDFYVESGDLRNPTSTIIHHIEKQCKEAPRGAGPVQIKFGIVDDVDEIREAVIRSLPRIHKCKMCRTQLEEASQSDKMRHLAEQHENSLFELR